MRNLITAFASALPTEGIPTEIVYLPEGEHRITPFVDGKAKAITVKVPAERGAQIAAALQGALDERKKANVRPWFDFEHKAGVASALPTGFRYEPGKGIMAAVEWTGAGRAAIEGKDFSYFSPTFFIGKDDVPDGLPERGPLGALVNEPAFREIPRIAASDAAGTTPTPDTMSKLIFAALAISAAAENAETEAVQAIEKLKSDHRSISAKAADLEKANGELKKKADAAEAEAKKTRKERAETLVKAAVADGRIAPKDEDRQTKFRDKIEAGDSFAEEILAGLPKLHEGLDKPVVKAGQGDRGTQGGHSIETKARELVTAKQATSFDHALELISASDPALYSDYLKTLAPAE